MDFGVSLEGMILGTDTKAAGYGVASVDTEAKQGRYRSGFLKHERPVGNDEVWRSSKLVKADSMQLPPLHNQGVFSRTDSAPKEPQILSFCCPKTESLSADRSSLSPSLFSLFHLSYANSGFPSQSFDSGGMQMGAFTQSQWMELEHQALIYKHLTNNVPIPSNLLMPIRKAVDSSRLNCFPGSLARPGSFVSMSAYHLGYAGSTDPEPGRCRRTDGKKWRCSRDAVADQKYCERHINRGRHRSRKPVEDQTHKNVKHSTSSTQNDTVSNCLHIDFQSDDISHFNRRIPEKDNLMTAGSFLSGGDCSALSWHHLDYQSEKSCLSASLPMATADYMSSTSSPTISPLRMGLGVYSARDESNSKLSWGPLGEVMNSGSCNSFLDCNNSPALNLMSEGWDNSCHLQSSPTAVLAKTNFPSASNSSASSPRKTYQSGSLS